MQTSSLEWNPVLEHRLKEARHKAGWRWIGYSLVLLSLGVLWLMFWSATEFDGEAKLGGQSWVLFAPSALMLLLALLLALPAEKAAKVAKELSVQKAAASSAPQAVARVAPSCVQCGSALPGGVKFCGQCGLPRSP